MFIYELAIELGKHSSEVAEAARAMGMADVGPASELTREQVAAVRSRFGPPAPPPPPTSAGPAAGAGPSGPMTWGEVPSSPPPPPAPGPGVGASALPDEPRSRLPVVVVAVVAAIAVGAIAYMGVSSGADPEREREIAESDPLDGATTTTDPDAMRGHAAFCTAAKDVVSFERGLVEALQVPDLVLLNESAKLRHRWKEQVDIMRVNARPSLDADLAAYVEINEQLLDAIVATTDANDLIARTDAIDLDRGIAGADAMFAEYDTYC